MNDCMDCKFHETFSDEMEDGFIDDGCICHNEDAEKENKHIKCCLEYGGKDKCPYKGI